MSQIPEILKPVEILGPASDAAGRTGDYVSLKNAHRVYFVCQVVQGNAAQVTFAPHQASAVAGTGDKVLASTVPIWANLDCAAGDTLTRAADAVNYQTDAAVKHKIVVFQVDPLELDTAGGFDCLTMVTSASHADNVTSCVAYIVPRYAGSSSPSVLTD